MRAITILTAALMLAAGAQAGGQTGKVIVYRAASPQAMFAPVHPILEHRHYTTYSGPGSITVLMYNN